MIEIVFSIIAAGIVSGVMSFTITMSALFAPLRLWMEKEGKFVGDLFQCPHCLGYYISLFWSILLFKRDVFHGDYLNVYNWLLFIFIWFLVVGIMSLYHKPVLTAYDPVIKIKAQKNLDKLKVEKARERETETKS